VRKLIELDEFFPKTGEATVQPVLLWGNGRRIDTSRITKHASAALDYIKSVMPEPGKTILLLNAMGAEETYGPNRNGDGFPEHPVPARGKVASTGRRWFIEPGQELTKHYQSFETNPAHAFKHHANRDPAKASGVVKKAFWNPRMHRVELLIAVDDDKDPEWVKRASDGEFVPVSMGCFLKGAHVTMMDGTSKPIENVKVGDYVITHRGRARRVTETHARPYRGDVYAIKAEAHAVIRATSEHPFLTTRRETVKEPKRCGAGWGWRADAKVQSDWTHAKCLDAQMLLEPMYVPENPMPAPTRAEARLLGYYLAEGHIIWRDGAPYGIELSTNKADPVHAEIDELCAAYGTRNKPYTFDRPHSVEASNIAIHDERLALFCHEHAGTPAKDKRLSATAMAWPVELQRELLGAYLNGDGHGRDGWLKASTASDALAAQLMRLLPRLGVLASCNRLHHKAGSGFSREDTFEWVIHIGAQWAHVFAKTCAKFERREVRAKKESRKVIDGYVCTPIRGVTVEYMETTVYNFEVEEDESYLVEGLAVHNCRIKYDVCARCGNHAPTRADYCDHVKLGMNQVDSTGFKDYVHNPSPDFFDISRVFRPADRTGYTLKKVADVAEIRLSADLGAEAEQLAAKAAAAQKLSEIDKIIRAEPIASSTLSPDEKSLIVKFRDHAHGKLAGSIDVDVRALEPWPLGETLSAAATRGVVLKDAEFIPLAACKLAGARVALSHDLVAKVAAASRHVLAMFADRPELLDEIIDSGVLESQKIAREATAVFDGARVKRAYMGEYLYRRLVPEGIGMRPDGAPTTDVLSVGPYETTRGAALDAQDAVTRAHMGKVLGGSALLLGGYKALTAFPWMRRFKLPLAIGAGALGAATLGKRPGGTMRTDEGYEIPDITELTQKSAASMSSIVHLVECASTPHPSIDFSRVKTSSTMSMDAIAETLGAIVLT
jgi:hypothetical protein